MAVWETHTFRAIKSAWKSDSNFLGQISACVHSLHRRGLLSKSQSNNAIGAPKLARELRTPPEYADSSSGSELSRGSGSYQTNPVQPQARINRGPSWRPWNAARANGSMGFLGALARPGNRSLWKKNSHVESEWRSGKLTHFKP